MQHIFIINPGAGRKGRGEKLKARIFAASAKLGIPVEVYETKCTGDGEAYVRERCSQRDKNESLRFYACGGDGALSEVVNGTVGFDFAEIGCIPTGTGNDYIRNYGQVNEFLDIERQLQGQTIDSDIIQYSGEIDGREQTRYCINMFNIGFDCNVVDQTSRVKRWPLVSGSLAYLISIAIVLIRNRGANLKITARGDDIHDGALTLIAISNGCYCGGGIKGSPKARTNDGKLDIMLIKPVNRRTFVTFFPKYKKGIHLQEQGLAHKLDYRQCGGLSIVPKGGTMRLCVDGEIVSAEAVDFTIVPKAIRFVVPIKG